MGEDKNTVRAYSIYDIAKWQMELQESPANGEQDDWDERITLPTLQRGFVWKPYQMEALWDSILRGYPIGALLLSQSGNSKDLLDGQQRCTTIALGFQNPFVKLKRLLNLKHVPTIWIDLKPVDKNKYGLRLGVRVLTRSHPWGYQLADHRKPVSTFQRAKALAYLRKRCSNPNSGFSEISSEFWTPWDAHYPVPLFMLLKANSTTYDQWRNELLKSISSHLVGVETSYGEVSYDQVEESWLCDIYKAVQSAMELLLPEIPVNKRVIAEDDDLSDSVEDATLFIRLNAEGTRISGQELIYSLLKAEFPEAKKLVEEIDLRFVAPTKLVNIFIRFVIISLNSNPTYLKDVSLTAFRTHLKDDSFKHTLKEFIEKREAKALTKRAIEIFSEHPYTLPKIFIRDMMSGTIDLLLVLLIYLRKNEQVNDSEKAAIRNTFTQVFLFGLKNDKVAAELFSLLANNEFKDWKDSMERIINEKPELILRMLSPKDFENILLGEVMPKYIKEGKHFTDPDLIRKILRENEIIRNKLVMKQSQENANTDEDRERVIDQAVSYWVELCTFLFRNKHCLIIAQREYFEREFGEYMEFEGIEDTNRPWDWDHIYPNSWVYKKHKISSLVKNLVSTTGNYRALSFNENRGQNNHHSPQSRFHNNVKAQEDSFVKSSDLDHWLELSNEDSRLVDLEKIGHFVKAVFNRVNNIYSECYSVITESVPKTEKP
jgi:hypothetical protein